MTAMPDRFIRWAAWASRIRKMTRPPTTRGPWRQRQATRFHKLTPPKGC